MKHDRQRRPECAKPKRQKTLRQRRAAQVAIPSPQLEQRGKQREARHPRGWEKARGRDMHMSPIGGFILVTITFAW
ncbi:hypothetical protein CS8_049890 [Cupriavidus sp. 8B]